MNSISTITTEELPNYLLTVAPYFPVFIWGPPGIGKSSIVSQFAASLNYECVTLIGQQLAPEDLIGVPKVEGNVSRFCPPSMLVKDKPYCLFLDEFNAASTEIQKAFMNLVLEKRIGEYKLPQGSIIIAAGNRQEDSALVKNIPSPLINRMFHIQLSHCAKTWINWGLKNNIHQLVIDYITNKPSHLFSSPPKTQEPFSTPRSWAMLGTLISTLPEKETTYDIIKPLVQGVLTPSHAQQFLAYLKIGQNKNLLTDIIKGKARWPKDPGERDLLVFLLNQFKDYLILNIPLTKANLTSEQKELIHNCKARLRDCALISPELLQMLLVQGDEKLPTWFLIDLIKDIPSLKLDETK